MSVYTVFIDGEVFADLTAIDDSHALLFVLEYGLDSFTLCRTGVNHTIIRTVAEVNNQTVC